MNPTPRLIDNGPSAKTKHDRRHRQRWTDFDILGIGYYFDKFGKSVGINYTGFRIYGPCRDQTEIEHKAKMTVFPKKIYCINFVWDHKLGPKIDHKTEKTLYPKTI